MGLGPADIVALRIRLSAALATRDLQLCLPELLPETGISISEPIPCWFCRNPAFMVADQIVMTSYKGRTKAKTIGHHVEMIRGGGWLRLAFHPDKNL